MHKVSAINCRRKTQPLTSAVISHTVFIIPKIEQFETLLGSRRENRKKFPKKPENYRPRTSPSWEGLLRTHKTGRSDLQRWTSVSVFSPVYVSEIPLLYSTFISEKKSASDNKYIHTGPTSSGPVVACDSQSERGKKTNLSNFWLFIPEHLWYRWTDFSFLNNQCSPWTHRNPLG